MSRNFLLAFLAAVVTLNLVSTGMSAPTVSPGYGIEKYVDIPNPNDLDIDSDGNIYVGNDTPGGPIRIRKVTPDQVVTEIGDPLADPDAILIDKQGDVVGQGNIIVGDDFRFVEVDPVTGSTSTIFTGIPQYNIQTLALDSTGRLFGGSLGGGFVTVIENGSLSLFYEFSGSSAGAVEIDENDQLFVGLQNTGQIFSFDLTSPGLPSLLATIPGTPIRFGYTTAAGPFSSTLFLGTLEGEIYTIDRTTGNFELFASGFGTAHGIAFGPEGSMFVSDKFGNAIYRVTVPEPASLAIVLIGLVLLSVKCPRHSARARFAANSCEDAL